MRIRVKLISLLLAFGFVVSLASCGSGTGNTVMTVGKYEVSGDEYLYYYKNHRKANPEADDAELKRLCEESARNTYALDALAEKFGYKITKDDHEQIEAQMAEAVKMYGGEDGYKEALAKACMTEAVHRGEVTHAVLEMSLRDFVGNEFADVIKQDDATVEADIKSNFFLIRQLYIKKGSGDGDESATAAQSPEYLARELCERIAAGEDMDALIEKYGEDISQSAQGYCFTYGQMLEEIENAAVKLAVGEVSGVVESSGGYHIIKRLSLTQEYIDAHFEELRYYYRCRVFNEMRSDIGKTLEISYTDAFKKLTLTEPENEK